MSSHGVEKSHSQGAPFKFSAENLAKYEELLTRYDDVESALLPVLH